VGPTNHAAYRLYGPGKTENLAAEVSVK